MDVLAAPTPVRRSPVRRGFRPDIEGLRAVAVGGVLLFHAGVSRFGGGFVGVDVFFVISGFLITGLIHRELAATGRLSFTRFYARRAKRLLPAASFVLAVTAIASALVLPSLQRATAGKDITSSALYVVNWTLARAQSDYLNPAVAPSPVQHYWSLAVEEQFYFLWPVLLAVITVVAVRRRLRLRVTLFAVLSVVGALSFALALHQTATNQPYAFFGSPSRMWELAFGGCLALATPALTRVPPAARAALGWAGLVAVVGSMLVLSASTPFPGTAALWPVLGTGAVLAAGTAVTPAGPQALLARGPFRGVGRISYSWYLWHWPPLILVAAWTGRELSTAAGLAIVVASGVPAYLSWRWLEEPFRLSERLTREPRRALVLAAVLTLVGTVAGLLLVSTASGVTTVVRDRSGAVVKVDAAAARRDLPVAYSDGCRANYGVRTAKLCTYGDATAPTSIALFGDSHALQWLPAMTTIAAQRGSRLELLAKTSCSPADVTVWDAVRRRGYDQCDAWRRSAVAALTAPGPNRPDVVVVGTRDAYLVTRDGRALPKQASDPLLVAGLERTYRELAAAGIHVIAIGDVPMPAGDIPDCLSAHLNDVTACDFPRSAGQGGPALERVAAAAVPGVSFVDPTRVVCPRVTCGAVDQGTVTYRDSQHLTASYVRAITRKLDALLAAAGLRATR